MTFNTTKVFLVWNIWAIFISSQDNLLDNTADVWPLAKGDEMRVGMQVGKPFFDIFYLYLSDVLETWSQLLETNIFTFILMAIFTAWTWICTSVIVFGHWHLSIYYVNSIYVIWVFIREKRLYYMWFCFVQHRSGHPDILKIMCLKGNSQSSAQLTHVFLDLYLKLYLTPTLVPVPSLQLMSITFVKVITLGIKCYTNCTDLVILARHSGQI